MELKKVSIFANGEPQSELISGRLKQKLEKSGFTASCEFDPDASLLICIGGDGSFLHTLHAYDFPEIPIVGVNTGHLGFFQELHHAELDEFIFRYENRLYEIQSLRPVVAEIDSCGLIGDEHGRAPAEEAAPEKAETLKKAESGGGFPRALKGLNEIVVRNSRSRAAHLNIFIGESFIERFSGDGILVSTPAGSTAYNYALGGSIVDPRLSLLQITPIAPINNAVYRSFTSSVLLPPDLSVQIFPEYTKDQEMSVSADGMEWRFSGVKRIRVGFARRTVQLLRFDSYDFWKKVKG
ncbi:MAG: NAD(+)/NADH kinase, partial [Clostridiales Family XIII bacterium]|nr:NAD(+)/NADH kinase [Clostridiales Family XIII bacterium]